ncbi:MAG: sugar transferase [Tabrizicola sp.]|uniref:sugar transferase n=1 Tax=Tabrizicola sp. TaxID=2005166 RepID=UPI00274B8127|nr:sugar transferase [Tabrizicola sp.]MDP3648456.1 sugar transferase [Paracoccaceae bacterium]MDZ4067758.1 sugar transferase [Tabrizicola sp.]
MTVRIKAGTVDFDRARVEPREAWLLPRRERLYRRTFKRVIDVAFVLLIAPFILPMVLALCVLIALDGSSPFYTQLRVGKGGRTFRLWKLRSMVPDADERLARHLADNEAARMEWNAYQKLASDPRITTLGLALRKTSFDELPQLWNVLKGDMSLVGPRPMMPEQRDLYPGHAYYALRPGVTGPWQVSDRNTATFAQRAEFDTAYERNVSFATDVRLLIATVGVVLRGTGQ